MQIENLTKLKINKLTKEQYDREFEAGTLSANELYLTPEEEIDLSSYATVEQLKSKADTTHNHDDAYYTETEIDSKLAEVDTAISGKANASHTHSIVDIEEAESTVHKTLVVEDTVSAGSNLSAFKNISWSSLVGKNLILSVGGIDYSGECSQLDALTYQLNAGDYTVTYNLIDNMAQMSPALPSGTSVQLFTSEAALVIPEAYLPDTIARKQYVDEELNGITTTLNDTTTKIDTITTTLNDTTTKIDTITTTLNDTTTKIDDAIANNTCVNIITWEDED